MTDTEIYDLHQKYAPSDVVFELVYVHCQIVRDIALQLVESKDLAMNRQLVSDAAMLHDIGVHQLFTADGVLRDNVNYITHGTAGETLLRSEGFPEHLWRVASHHTGVGLTKQDVIDQKLPLPVADYLAESDLEALIMYADKFHSKTIPPYFNSFEWYRQDIARFGADKVVKFDALAEKFGKPDLEPLSEAYGFDIR